MKTLGTNKKVVELGATWLPKLKKWKNSTLKKFLVLSKAKLLYFKKWNFQALELKKILIFLEIEISEKISYISGANFWALKKVSYILRNGTFLTHA